MTEHVPLDNLVLNLLALVEAAPELPVETLARLAVLKTTVEPTMESLVAVSLRIKLELINQPRFQTALHALEMLAPPERHGLSLDEALKTLPNPTVSPASGIEALHQATVQVLHEPRQPPQSLLQRLAALVTQSFPHRQSAPTASQEPGQPTGDQP